MLRTAVQICPHVSKVCRYKLVGWILAKFLGRRVSLSPDLNLHNGMHTHAWYTVRVRDGSIREVSGNEHLASEIDKRCSGE
jgi:hypothetical protein